MKADLAGIGLTIPQSKFYLLSIIVFIPILYYIVRIENLAFDIYSLMSLASTFSGTFPFTDSVQKPTKQKFPVL